MFNCIICVDRMDGTVSSSSYTKESGLFKTQRRQPAKINVHACSALCVFATSLNEGDIPFPLSYSCRERKADKVVYWLNEHDSSKKRSLRLAFPYACDLLTLAISSVSGTGTVVPCPVTFLTRGHLGEGHR